MNQLGTTFLVYPSANHTRFEHSLGTLFVIDNMLTLALTNRPQEILKWNKDEAEYYRGLARLSALLHDLGHAPFSHAGEELFPIAGQEQKLTHEDYTFGIITETELSQYIDNCYGPGAARKVAEIATGRAKTREMAFLSELLTGDFGADRIDYLIRDSYHLGVQYGRFDVPRLLNTIHVRLNEEKQGPELALESGGLHTVEGFLLARYFMFLDVYFHKTRRILDQHLVDLQRNRLILLTGRRSLSYTAAIINRSQKCQHWCGN
ncbi:MAG: HD domain-containing protein [Bacillota bacterium]|nr:HD domain-containing protein [Bacillota bacterium]